MGTDQGGRLPRELAREKARQVARRSEQHSRSVAASDLCSLPAGSPGWMWIRHAGTTRHRQPLVWRHRSLPDGLSTRRSCQPVLRAHFGRLDPGGWTFIR